MTPSEIQAEIRQLTRQLKALRRKLPKAPSKAFKGQMRVEDRKTKRETYRKETARIRQERMGIAGGSCEWWLSEPYVHRCQVMAPLHMHHLLGGIGRRRQKQTVQNVRMFCAPHHAEAHRHPEGKP